MSNIKNLGKEVIIYGLGHFLARFLNFLLLPIYTNSLEPHSFGIITLLFAFIAFSNILFVHGMDVSFMRFFGLEKDTDIKKILFSTSLSSVFMSSFILGCIYYYSSDTIAELTIGVQYNNLIRLSIFIIIADAFISIPKVLLRLQNKPYYFIFLEMIHVIIVLILNIWWIGIKGLSIDYIFFSNLIASLIVCLISFFFIRKYFSLRLSLPKWNELIIFAIPYIPAGFASIINELIDRYMIKWLVDEKAVGLYASSYKLGIFMLVLVTSFKFAWQPFFLKQADNKNAPKVFATIGTYFLIISFYLLLVISFFINYLVQFSFFGISLINQNYWSSLDIVPIVLLAYIVLGVFIIQIPGIYIKKKNNWIPILNCSAAIINVTANFIFIPFYGYKFAALATLIGYSCMVILQYFVINKFYEIQWEWYRLSFIIFLFIILFSFWKLSGDNPIIGLLNLVAYPFLLYFLPFFNNKEKEKLKTFISIAN